MRTAIVTASYRGDLERCRLLCESIDRHVSGHTRHLILVEERDRALFAPLAGPKREIVGERALLPAWLRPVPDPTRLGRRRLWLSPFGPPLRGWHVQQLRRIAAARRMPEEVMLSCDSDVVFVKPFDAARLQRDGAVRFHRQPRGFDDIIPGFRADHRRWSARAADLLGIAAPREVATGYIATCIAWRTDTIRALAERIETVTGRPALAALAADRALSECTIYGRFVDEVENRPTRHFAEPESLCRVYWDGAAMGEGDLAAFVAALGPEEVAIGIQSFTGTDPDLIRRAARLR
ncbi:hypothetical protein GCM10011390_14590 [Aureimonas endophytica]|uniref:Uncharacterized protein n=1 Tax=Aureimonas endophytica TaxID=2027858 RepID=A0A917E2I3_9HYPH|nr:DUF6492 family protein [Aureimonas endophytica]GGD96900.1 hypothetical protein GCM10011390_14590 [Aureimonas endophytica]